MTELIRELRDSTKCEKTEQKRDTKSKIFQKCFNSSIYELNINYMYFQFRI